MVIYESAKAGVGDAAREGDVKGILGLTIAVALAAFSLAGCGDESDTPTPPAPQATSTATPAPPIPTATPLPPTLTPTSVPPTPTSPPPSQSKLPDLGPDTTGRDLAEALFSDEETACMRGAMGENGFEAMMETPVMGLNDPSASEVMKMCLGRQTAADLYVAMVNATTQGLTEEGSMCLRTSLGESDVELFAAETDPAILNIFFNCLSEEELAALAPLAGGDTGGEFVEVDALAQLREQAKTNPKVKAMMDCLEEEATEEQLEAYFNEDSQTLPPAAFKCFELAQ